MRDALNSNSRVGGQMQLTILSAEILKSQLGAKLDISISCNISELPNYHCNLIFTQRNQEIGPIGFLKFDSKRPLASAVISLKEDDFDDIYELLKTSPPRSASIFLYTEIYNEDAIISRSMSGETSTVDINDLSWRYPLI